MLALKTMRILAAKMLSLFCGPSGRTAAPLLPCGFHFVDVAKRLDEHVRVMREAEAIIAICRCQFAGAYEGSFVVACNTRAVDGAHHLIPSYGERDVLSHRLAAPGCFMNRGVALTQQSLHSERLSSKSAHDKLSVSTCSAVELGLARSTHVLPSDKHSVGMRVRVEIHVFWLVEWRFDCEVP